MPFVTFTLHIRRPFGPVNRLLIGHGRRAELLLFSVRSHGELGVLKAHVSIFRGACAALFPFIQIPTYVGN